MSNLLFCLIAPFPCLFQADGRVDAKRNPFLFAVEPVLQPPPLAPAGGNFKVQTLAIRKFDGLVSRLGRTNCGVCEGHVGATPFLREFFRQNAQNLPPLLPPNVLAVNEPTRISMDNEEARNAGFIQLFRASMDIFVQICGAGGRD